MAILGGKAGIVVVDEIAGLDDAPPEAIIILKEIRLHLWHCQYRARMGAYWLVIPFVGPMMWRASDAD